VTDAQAIIDLLNHGRRRNKLPDLVKDLEEKKEK